MPYDPKKVRSLISTATAHRMHPGGEIAMALAEQLEAVDGMITAANAATTDAQNGLRRAQIDLETANKETAEARAKVLPLQQCIEALTAIATNAKGAKSVALTVLKANGIDLETPKPTTPSAE